MSPRASGGQVRPGGAGAAGGEWLWWLVPAAFAAAAAASTATLLGGWLASGLSGHGFHAPGWRLSGAADLRRVAVVWPGTPPALVVTLTLLVLLGVLAALAVPVVVGVRAMRRPRPAVRSLAGRRELAALHTDTAAATALRLRPQLAARHARHDQPAPAGRRFSLGRLRARRAAARAAKPLSVPTADRGVTLGRLLPAGALLQASWEDVILVVFAPRAGKTTAIAIPAVLAAPGAVVACSNKADVLLATAAARAGRGRVWVFDPQGLARTPQGWWWNPLGGRLSVDDATRLAGAFISAVAEDDSREIWGPAASELLANLLLAASLAGGTLLEVYAWLYDEATEVPVRRLRAAGYAAAADSLAGTQGLHPETRGSVYFTARAGCASLRDPSITRWVTPQPGLPEFTPAAFIAGGGDTLYLLSKNVAGGTSAAALVSALTTEVRVAAERAGERRGGRLDPPLLLVLDEVANICRIPDLPQQYSHMGSRSIVPIAILQSYAQGERVWGKAGMKELWGAATVKVVGSGADDADFAEDVSRIVGDHEINVLSYNRGRDGTTSSTSTRRERILPAADIRALPKGTALVLATGLRPAMIRLLPWYTGPDRDAIAAAAAAAAADLLTRAATPDQHPDTAATAEAV